MVKKKKIAIVIVSHKEPPWILEKCLESIEKEKKKLDLQIFLISNREKNLGFAQGANLGIKKALKWGAEIVFIANPDIILENETLAKIVPYFDKGYDILGGMMFMNGKMYAGGKINQRMFGSLCQIAKKPSKEVLNVDFVSGSLMGIKRNVFKKIGFLNEDYFLYYDDPEFCYRADQANFRIGIVTDAQYLHRELSVSFSEKDYYLTRNRLFFLFKKGNFGAKIKEIIRLPKTILEILKKEKLVRSYELLGLRDFLRNKKGRL